MSVRTLINEVRAKDPLLVFLAETKVGTSRIKGIQTKLEYTQGIVVQSDGWSGGLALLWREGTEVSFKSCSNSHINVILRKDPILSLWRVTSFYGQPETEKRNISWQLLEALKFQCDLPWILFRDFNEIMCNSEKSRGLDRDARQIEGFRDCLSRCGPFDLGFMGQWFTWCNGCLGNQRTTLQLDRMVANEAWMRKFPKSLCSSFFNVYIQPLPIGSFP